MSRTVEYRDLKGRYVLVDVRTPGEFEESTINGAVNIPLFTNEERALVGTIYTRECTEKAKRVGVEIVSKRLPEIYNKFCELEKEYGEVIIFCARGGMRSASITEFLGSLGVKVRRIKGGYKGYRAYINEELPKVNEGKKYIVLHGNTGVGKTEILKDLTARGCNVLDLEGAANHRGSILGSVGLGDCMTQKQFESNIFEQLSGANGDYVFVEAESKRIGRVIIPDYIHSAMKNGIHIFVDANVDFRSRLIIDEYTKHEQCGEQICSALDSLKKYIGEKNAKAYCELVRAGEYEEVVKELMIKYYDPLYTHSSDKFEYERNIMVEDIAVAAKELMEYYTILCHREKLQDRV